MEQKLNTKQHISRNQLRRPFAFTYMHVCMYVKSNSSVSTNVPHAVDIMCMFISPFTDAHQVFLCVCVCDVVDATAAAAFTATIHIPLCICHNVYHSHPNAR